MKTIKNTNKLLLLTLFLFWGSIVKADTIKLKEVEYTKGFTKWLELTPEARKNVMMPRVNINNVKDKFIFTGANSKLDGVTKEDDKFSLKEKGLVTSVKNQGATNACWAFAANASIESNLLMNDAEEYDLSEAHIELSLQKTYDFGRKTFNREIDTGGNYVMSSAYFMNSWGPVKEETLPFNKLEQVVSSKKVDSIVSNSDILNNKAILDVNDSMELGDTEPADTPSKACSENAIDDIKEYLITFGAVAATTHFKGEDQASKYVYYDGKAYQDLEDKTVAADADINHGITIVGWDDTISKDKFGKEGARPSRDGAWIIKNSYGESQVIGTKAEIQQELFDAYQKDPSLKQTYNTKETVTDEVIKNAVKTLYKLEEDQITIDDNVTIKIGNDGYQYISYDDVHICEDAVGYFEVDDDVEKYTYGYDELGIHEYVQSTEKVVYLASHFTKQATGREELQEVATYLYKPGYDYEIYFINGESLDLDNAKLIASGKTYYTGYRTFKISDAPVISSDKYTIIIKLTSPTEEGPAFGVTSKSASSPNLYADFEATKGVQFVSNDGLEYADIVTASDNKPMNLVMKAYTDDTTREPDVEPPKTDNEPGKDSDIDIDQNEYNKDKNPVQNNPSDADTPTSNPKTGYVVPIISLVVIAGVGMMVIYKKNNKLFKI